MCAPIRHAQVAETNSWFVLSLVTTSWVCCVDNVLVVDGSRVNDA